MTQTSTPALPAYVLKGHNHGLTSITGYDVVATLQEGPRVSLWVIAAVEGASNYVEALRIANGAKLTGEFTSAYVANRYDCGCREAGYVASRMGVDYKGDRSTV
jgi:hypothetical protein